jgi:hypothetical protein
VMSTESRAVAIGLAFAPLAESAALLAVAA